MSKHIAFIGVGNMGNPMAQQLVNAGKQVKVFDVSEQAIKIAKETGLNVVNSLHELLSNSSTVISMLPEGKHVQELYLGENGILTKISHDSLIIECSTIDIETSLALGSEAKNIGILDSGLSLVQLGSSPTANKSQMTRHEKRFGITSFLYQSKRPFHPDRLYNQFIKQYFMPFSFQEDNDEDKGTQF